MFTVDVFVVVNATCGTIFGKRTIPLSFVPYSGLRIMGLTDAAGDELIEVLHRLGSESFAARMADDDAHHRGMNSSQARSLYGFGWGWTGVKGHGAEFDIRDEVARGYYSRPARI